MLSSFFIVIFSSLHQSLHKLMHTMNAVYVSLWQTVNVNSGITDPQQIKQQLLSQLVDIQTPEAIGLWPFAPGIWLIIFLCFAFIATVLWLQIKRKKNKYRIVALQKSAVIFDCYNQSVHDGFASKAYIHDILILLKQVTFTAFPHSRVTIAGYSANDFIQFILHNLLKNTKQVDSKQFNLNELVIPENLLYGNLKETHFSVHALHDLANLWIKKHNRNQSIVYLSEQNKPTNQTKPISTHEEAAHVSV